MGCSKFKARIAIFLLDVLLPLVDLFSDIIMVYGYYSVNQLEYAMATGFHFKIQYVCYISV